AIGAIAAAVVIAAVIAGFAFLRPKPVDTNTHTTAVVSTATSGTQVVVPPPGQQGRLLLSASPWGELEKIVNLDNNQLINLDDEKKSTPTAILLDPGKYAVTVRGPDASQTIDVTIQAGQSQRKTVVTGN